MTISNINLLLITLLFMFAGCVSTDEITEAKTHTYQCPDISGMYKNIGLLIVPELPTEPDPTIGAGDPYILYPPELSQPALPCTITGNGEIFTLCVLSQVLEVPWDKLPANLPAIDLVDTRVEIGKIEDGVISVRLYKNKQVAHEFYLGKEGRPYICKDGSIHIREDFRARSYPSYHSSSGVFALKPDVDDSLVLELDVKRFGYAGLIPYSDQLKFSYRWQRAK